MAACMVWRTLFIAWVRAMQGPTAGLRARRTGSPITAFYFDHMPKYADSPDAKGNQPGTFPGWATDRDSGDSGLTCVSGWPRPDSPAGSSARTGGWGASGSSGGWGGTSVTNSTSGWGAPASAAARSGGGWGGASGNQGGAADDDHLDAEARLERVSTPTQARPGSVSLPGRLGEGAINSQVMQNDGQGSLCPSLRTVLGQPGHTVR